jgi:hypothetical protein
LKHKLNDYSDPDIFERLWREEYKAVKEQRAAERASAEAKSVIGVWLHHNRSHSAVVSQSRPFIHLGLKVTHKSKRARFWLMFDQVVSEYVLIANKLLTSETAGSTAVRAMERVEKKSSEWHWQVLDLVEQQKGPGVALIETEKQLKAFQAVKKANSTTTIEYLAVSEVRHYADVEKKFYLTKEKEETKKYLSEVEERKKKQEEERQKERKRESRRRDKERRQEERLWREMRSQNATVPPVVLDDEQDADVDTDSTVNDAAASSKSK